MRSRSRSMPLPRAVQPPAVLRSPAPRVQRATPEAAPGKAPGAPLDEYLGKRETAQTVPARGALSVHPEIPDTLRTKPLAQRAALDARLARARKLGHRLA